MKKIICLIFALSLLYGCKSKDDSSVLYSVIDKYYNENKSSELKIDLAKALPFDWDSLFVFDYSKSPEEIDSILNGKYGYYDEFSSKIIFVKNNKVIRYETVPIKFQGIDPQGGGSLIIFPIDPDKNYVLVSKQNSIFTVKKTTNNFNEICYELNNP